MTHNSKRPKSIKHDRNNSLSTGSILMLTPPPTEEIDQENRRLSVSIEADNNNLLVPPPETDVKPEEIVHRLIDDRRASTITLLSDAIKNIFIQKKIKEDGIPVEISDNIYIGSIGAAHNMQWLKDNKITHVLCVAGGIQPLFPKHFNYKVIDIVDAPSVDIREYFKESFVFIDECVNNNGRILIHCFAGMSRSVAIVTAYLMKKYNMCAISALTLVRSKRKQANPNAGFIVQLLRFQKSLGISTKKYKESLPQLFHGTPGSSSSNKNVKLKSTKKGQHNIFHRRKRRQNAVTFANVIEYKNQQNLSVQTISASNVNHSSSGDSGNETEESISALDVVDHPIIEPFANTSHNRGTSLDSSESRHPMSLNPNMQVLEQWETGRRPSIFSALARLRALKVRSQSSTDSLVSSGSHASDERESDCTPNAIHNEVISSDITSINGNTNNNNDSNSDAYSFPTIETTVNIVVDDDDKLSVANVTGITPAVSPLSNICRDSPVLQLSSSDISPPAIACITPVMKLELLQEVSVEDDEPSNAYAIIAAVANKKCNERKNEEKENFAGDEQKNDGCENKVSAMDDDDLQDDKLLA